jgi:hypothetical protein
LALATIAQVISTVSATAMARSARLRVFTHSASDTSRIQPK